MRIIQDYSKVDGTGFQVVNCPCNCRNICKSPKRLTVSYCFDTTNCPVKSHAVGLAALLGICIPNSSQWVGVKRALDDLLISDERNIDYRGE